MNDSHPADAFPTQTRKNRLSRQRETILAAMHEADSTDAHLDAHALYLRAKRKDNKISLSTVYRALAALTSQGLVRKLVLDSGRRFYEIARPVEGHHFVCLNCGGVFDLNPVLDVDERSRWQDEVEVVAVQVTIKGYCTSCRAERARRVAGMS